MVWGMATDMLDWRQVGKRTVPAVAVDFENNFVQFQVVRKFEQGNMEAVADTYLSEVALLEEQNSAGETLVDTRSDRSVEMIQEQTHISDPVVVAMADMFEFLTVVAEFVDLGDSAVLAGSREVVVADEFLVRPAPG